MEQLILVVHLLVALAIIGLIMLQQGKGADMGASFGAGSSQTLFGSEGSGNALTKATTLLAVLFFASSMALAIVAKTQSAGVAAEYDIPVPGLETEGAAQQMATELNDVPVVEGDVPSLSDEGDIPEM
ncbi:preprotein translocase subunit SecG [Halieaceae bacterium]|nr:preprotein translocase subunit SecG [Halieaceae bacterium]